MRRYIIALGIMLLAVACVNTADKGIKKVLDKDAVGIYNVNSNNVVFDYSDEACQQAFSIYQRITRIQSDDQSRLVQLKLASAPMNNANVDVEMVVRGVSSLTSGTVKMKVLKVEDAKIWLFYADKNIGFVMPW